MRLEAITPADEHRHHPEAGRAWEESWYFDFAAADGSVAGFVRLSLHPATGLAWFWAGVVGGGATLVSVRDHEVPLPTGAGLEVRASGLWTEFVCETPLDHWSVGLEAFGVAFDDPLEAWRSERGDPCALGLDVEWEGAEACRALAMGDGGLAYQQACVVHGEVLVGSGRFQLDGSGARSHAWGPRRWADQTWWAAGRLDDGSTITASGSDEGPISVDDDGLLRSGRLPPTSGAVGVSVVAVAHAPVLIPGAGGLARALCRFETTGGHHGYGWAERFQPARGAWVTSGRPGDAK